jgi:hypothetical protein
METMPDRRAAPRKIREQGVWMGIVCFYIREVPETEMHHGDDSEEPSGYSPSAEE